jgi:two-component sensor histidine kinase
MTLPVRGGLGFFLTEALSNAMRHGAAGSVPVVVVRCDRVRKELAFRIENERRDDLPRSRSTYGGLAILEGMARLFGWRDYDAGAQGTVFVVTWRAPVTRRDQPGRPD